MERFEIDAFDRVLKIVGNHLNSCRADGLLDELRGSYPSLTKEEYIGLRSVVYAAILRYHFLDEALCYVTLTDLGRKVREKGMARYVRAGFLRRLIEF